MSSTPGKLYNTYELHAMRGTVDMFFASAYQLGRKNNYDTVTGWYAVPTYEAVLNDLHDNICFIDTLLAYQHDAVRDVSELIEELCIHGY